VSDTPIADQLQAVAERCDGYDYQIIMRARQRLADVTAERDRLIAEQDALMAALYEWAKWHDKGIEDFLPEWVKPVLRDTYEKTKELLASDQEEQP